MLKKLRLNLKNPEIILSLLIYIVLFLFLLYPYRDYDWGWHFKYGEYFFQHGTPYISDTFSWTMQGYKWVNHSWAYDILLYLLFTAFSFTGLSVAGTVVSFLAFYFCVKGIKLKAYSLSICAFLFAYLVSGVVWQGLRSQVVGLFLIAVVGYMLRQLDLGHKKFYILLPILFLCWANLHGSMTYGLALFAFFLIQKLFFDTRHEKGIYVGKNELYLVVSFVASVLLTLINPFGIQIYFEAVRHFSNPLLKYVIEWDPVQFPSSFYFMMIFYLLVLIATIILSYKKTHKINFYMIATVLASSYLAYGARRYVAVAIVGTLPFVALMFQNVKLDLNRFRVTQFLLYIGIAVSFELAIFGRIIPWKIFSNYTYTDYCSSGSHCSENLTSYLIKNPPQGKGFNFYDWGGYLIGRGVPVKLFLDGRMHLWKDEKTGFQPFLEYQKMYYDGDLTRFNKYDFDWIIAPTGSNISMYIQYKKDKDWKAAYMDSDATYWIRER